MSKGKIFFYKTFFVYCRRMHKLLINLESEEENRKRQSDKKYTANIIEDLNTYGLKK